jgi:hypothetical protein
MKTLVKLLMLLALGAVIYLPGMAYADYVQAWTENGIYLGVTQTWDKEEIFLVTPGNWTGTGLSGFSAAGWSAALINPQYALATGPLYNPTVSGNFNYTTSSTNETNPYTWDLFLWNGAKLVGVQRSTWTSAGWVYADLTATPPAENRVHAPLPATILLLGTGLLGLIGLRRKSGRDQKDDSI